MNKERLLIENMGRTTIQQFKYMIAKVGVL